MEDLYDNLENYHDENIIDELKNENANLKAKLEEYSSAMIRLQNDFDKLNLEYRKLEMNYSSLLKTARAEIERKSDMIKSLNQEKDLLVIKTLQSSGKNILNTRKLIFNENQANMSHEIKTDPTEKSQHTKGHSLDGQNERKSYKNDRNYSSTRTQSEATISSLENKSTFDEGKESRATNNYLKIKHDKTKEKVIKKSHKDIGKQSSKSKGQKIYNRRKSMPIGIEAIYSSEDDFEALNLKFIRKSPFKDDISYYEKYHNKDDFYNFKDVYKNKSRKYIDSDKSSKDRFETGHKYRKHGKSKEYNDNYRKDYSENTKFKGENYSKRRELRSPPNYKCSRSNSRERRFDLERERYYHKDRYISRHNTSANKHTITHGLEEPRSKRQKTETVTEEILYNQDRERGLHFRNSLTKHQDITEYSSCQSPDYDHMDSVIPQHIVKEIKHTSVTPLEDPRVSSNKYFWRNNKEKSVFSTIGSEHIDIQPINVSTWDIPNIKNFMVPIKETHQETNKNSSNEMFCINNDKTESHELQESSDIKSLKDNNIQCSKSSDSTDTNQGNKKNYKSQDKSEAANSLETIDLINMPKLDKDISKYKIPKIKIQDISVSKYKTVEKCTKKCDLNTVNSKEVSIIDKIVNVESDQDAMTKSNHRHKEPSEKRLRAINTLADDLELSDEASEIKDFHNRETKKSKKTTSQSKACSTSVNSNKCYIDSLSSENVNKHNKPKHISKSEESKRKVSKRVSSKESSRDSGKSRKCKKDTEQKETAYPDVIDKKNNLQEVLIFKDKEQKPSIPVHTKNKFSDLFGDSSSLITPDDLGIPPTETNSPLANKYISIFEDAQDASNLLSQDTAIHDVNQTQSNPSSSNVLQTALEDIASKENVKEHTDKDAADIIVSKDCAINAVEDHSSANSLYENTNCEPMNDGSDIVKTVIISTGMQPKHTIEDLTLQNTKEKGVEYLDEIYTKNSALSNVKALATSTPQKTVCENISQAASDLNSSNDASKLSDKINLVCNTSNSSNHNLNDKVKEADLPDVRIFVRRRRKMIKKP